LIEKIGDAQACRGFLAPFRARGAALKAEPAPELLRRRVELGHQLPIGCGAAAGGWAGSTIGHGKGRLVATAAGTFLGGLIGNQIGRSMDRTDRLYAVRSAGDALEREPDGGYAHWENPNTGNSGYTVPTRTYETAPGRYCREYQTTVVVGGRTQSGYGTACRQPDGSWQVVG